MQRNKFFQPLDVRVLKECLTSRQAEIEKKVDSQHPPVGTMQLRSSGPPQAHFLISGSSGSSPRAKHFASVSCCLSLLHGSTCFTIFYTKTLGKTFPAPNWGQIHYRYINQLYMYTAGVEIRSWRHDGVFPLEVPSTMRARPMEVFSRSKLIFHVSTIYHIHISIIDNCMLKPRQSRSQRQSEAKKGYVACFWGEQVRKEARTYSTWLWANNGSFYPSTKRDYEYDNWTSCLTSAPSARSWFTHALRESKVKVSKEPHVS